MIKWQRKCPNLKHNHNCIGIIYYKTLRSYNAGIKHGGQCHSCIFVKIKNLKNCEICEKQYKGREQSRCCSMGCIRKWKSLHWVGENNNHWKGGQFNKVCAKCKITFVSKDPRTIYCNEHRGAVNERNGNWNGGKLPITIQCKCCGTDIETTISQVRRGRKYCNRSCANIINNMKKNKHGTDIENLMEDWLIENKIEYEKQVPLFNIATADFLVGNIVIECDGDYWHNLPGRKEQDDIRDRKLQQNGYIVKRYFGSQILKGEMPAIEEIYEGNTSTK